MHDFSTCRPWPAAGCTRPKQLGTAFSILLHVGVLAASTRADDLPRPPAFSANREAGWIAVASEHFRLTVDASRGGETVALPAGMAPARAELLSPDAPDAQSLDLRVANGKASFVIPRLDLYGVVVLEPVSADARPKGSR
jgi:hypothetical protein